MEQANPLVRSFAEDRASVFLERQKERQGVIDDLSSGVVPVFHAQHERFTWGGCKYHPHLSLQPHLNSSGRVGRGDIFVRCSSWFRCPGADKCWFSYPIPRALFETSIPLGTCHCAETPPKLTGTQLHRIREKSRKRKSSRIREWNLHILSAASVSFCI